MPRNQDPSCSGCECVELCMCVLYICMYEVYVCVMVVFDVFKPS